MLLNLNGFRCSKGDVVKEMSPPFKVVELLDGTLTFV